MVITTAPPTVLTMEEYRRDWQPQGWQLIIIGPTSTWRQEWEEWEAIREIVQNALDETEAYSYGYDSQGLWIADKGKGVAVSDFLLGPPKLKPDWARGKYGEGMKIAALALTRLGYSVHIETVGREIWIIFLEQKVNGSAETLAAIWRTNGTRIGTKFHIVGYTGSAFENSFAINLPRSAIMAEGPSRLTQPRQRYNQLIDSSTTEGPVIYSRDIYMRTINSPYSYNLWSFELAPDRYAPKHENDLWVDMGRLWCCVDKVDLLQIFLQMVHSPPMIHTDESHNISMEKHAMGRIPGTTKFYAGLIKENALAWQHAWMKNFGEEAVIRTSDRWDSTVKHLGYESHSVHWLCQDTLTEAIPTDNELIKASQEKLREVQIIPDDKLNDRQRAHLELARAIANEAALPYPRASGVHAAIIPPASDRVRTAGMYSRKTREIYIALNQLDRGRTTVDTVIHEIAHHTSNAEDLEQRHAEHMTWIAARAVELTHEGQFDKLMKEVIW